MHGGQVEIVPVLQGSAQFVGIAAPRNSASVDANSSSGTIPSGSGGIRDMRYLEAQLQILRHRSDRTAVANKLTKAACGHVLVNDKASHSVVGILRGIRSSSRIPETCIRI